MRKYFCVCTFSVNYITAVEKHNKYQNKIEFLNYLKENKLETTDPKPNF